MWKCTTSWLSKSNIFSCRDEFSFWKTWPCCVYCTKTVLGTETAAGPDKLKQQGGEMVRFIKYFQSCISVPSFLFLDWTILNTMTLKSPEDIGYLESQYYSFANLSKQIPQFWCWLWIISLLVRTTQKWTIVEVAVSLRRKHTPLIEYRLSLFHDFMQDLGRAAMSHRRCEYAAWEEHS